MRKQWLYLAGSLTAFAAILISLVATQNTTHATGSLEGSWTLVSTEEQPGVVELVPDDETHTYTFDTVGGTFAFGMESPSIRADAVTYTLAAQPSGNWVVSTTGATFTLSVNYDGSTLTLTTLSSSLDPAIWTDVEYGSDCEGSAGETVSAGVPHKWTLVRP